MKREFDEIYRLYEADIYRYIYSLCRNERLSRDILQDTMLRAVTDYGKFRGDSSVLTWLCGIAKNLYLNHLKRAYNRNLSIEEAVLTSGESVEDRVLDSAQALELYCLVHWLDEPYREVFDL